jgi:hypothetical protein
LKSAKLFRQRLVGVLVGASFALPIVTEDVKAFVETIDMALAACSGMAGMPSARTSASAPRLWMLMTVGV